MHIILNIPMNREKRNKIVAAPLVSGVIGAFSFFMLYGMAGLREMQSTLGGVSMGMFVSAIFSVVIASVLFGELLARALESK